MQRHTLPLTALIASLCCGLNGVQAQQAHVHGQGQLSLVQDGQTVQVHLRLPAADAVGFEHAARTPEQHQAIANALARLKQTERVLRFPAETQCRLQDSTVSLGETGHDHGHDHGAHADVRADYRFRCDNPAALQQLQIALFDWLPQFQLQAEALTEHGAWRRQLDARQAQWRLE